MVIPRGTPGLVDRAMPDPSCSVKDPGQWSGHSAQLNTGRCGDAITTAYVGIGHGDFPFEHTGRSSRAGSDARTLASRKAPQHRESSPSGRCHDSVLLSVITHAVAGPSVERILVVGHTNCGGAAACIIAVIASTPSREPTTPLARWLAPLTAVARTLDLKDIPDSEVLTNVVEARVRRY
ncbi:hypothetical protein DFH94DRAFT_92586 [Russula ochroleuca]|uniref:Carbonic anhydrase n=1 Tax=Russula ochroleuca TaxID=152965 RepID=A0A9P5MSL0_9AGAM|nr:hypothetical protein DFH94DRAFT_92586 [Russula ochroleuca]